MEIQTIEISGFKSCFNTLRKPFKLPNRSLIENTNYKLEYFNDFIKLDLGNNNIIIDKKDLSLLKALIKKNDAEAKASRLINVTAEIEAPLFFWNELVTYTVGVTCGCSESTMHTLKKEKLTHSNFEYEISDDALQYLQSLIEDNASIDWIKNELPSGYLQKRDINFSYQTLARIYKQRKDHKLVNQWGTFCKWVEGLPLAKQLIIGEE